MKVDFLNLQRVNASFGTSLSDAVLRVIESGWYLHGSETAAFENEWAEYIGVKHCIGCGNGLDALTLVLLAWRDMEGWKEDDEVLVPANTFIATVLAISRAGLRPILCEPNPNDALLNPQELSKHLSARTRCIIPVHLYGRVCNMPAIQKFSESYGLKILEDACQAHGASLLGTKAGAWGHAAAFSFYPGKNLGALGDGGCVTTNDDTLAFHVRTWANYGERTRYVCEQKGLNSRLDELQAAVLRIKLQRLDADNQRRCAIAQTYLDRLPSSILPFKNLVHANDTSVFHIFPVRVPHRDEVRAALAQLGVMTQVHYPIPSHRQQAYKKYAHLSLPITESWANEELSLPISPVMTDTEVDYVINSVKTVLTLPYL